MGDVQDRFDYRFPFLMGDAEGLVQAEFADAVFLIKFRQGRLHLLRRPILPETHGQRADAVADTGIVHLALLHIPFIGKSHGKSRRFQLIHHIRKVIIKKFFKNSNVMQHRLIDGALHSSPDFTGAAVAVFIIHKQVRQIAVPQVA